MSCFADRSIGFVPCYLVLRSDLKLVEFIDFELDGDKA